ncbi:MAG TPA: NAD(P)-binding domain-containing protein [Acidimicrobiales bacterium]|nr:NAD(P)-binding domain-containing protein [Acidimicrobiales bacterium]
MTWTTGTHPNPGPELCQRARLVTRPLTASRLREEQTEPLLRLEPATRREASMKVAVIGAGNIGSTIGQAWAGRSHEVRFGVPAPAKYSELAGPGTTVTTVGDAVDGADAVLFAVPGSAVADILAQVAPALGGTIVLDATNNVGGGGELNAYAAVSAAAPGAHYYRAFNTLGWENFATPTFSGGERADLFYAGPDGPTRETVEGLVSDVGLQPVWVGGLEHVGTVDGVTRLWFALVMGRRMPRHTAFRVLTDA